MSQVCAMAIGAVVACELGCGARSGLPDSDSTDGACGVLGEGCSQDSDCCDAVCTDGLCSEPPPACLADAAPVMLATGFVEPYALGGNSTSLFVGELAGDRPLSRLSKAGGPAEALVENVSFVDFLLVREGWVFFSEEGAISMVPTKGGAKAILATAASPAGFDITPSRIYFADHDPGHLVQLDRGTLETSVLGGDFPSGIYRVAAAEEKGLIYFSDSLNAIKRYRLKDGLFDGIGIDIPPARAIRIFGGNVYYTVPALAAIYSYVHVVGGFEELLADLSPLGVFPEALESDGEFLYVTLETGTDSGLIVRIAMDSGEVQVVADAQGPRPSALVVDDACVYWTERETGSVFRAPKEPP